MRATIRGLSPLRISVVFLLSIFSSGSTTAQTVSVDATPSHALVFDPDKAMGSSMDILSDKEFDSLFTKDKPVIFNFHAYASLIHKFTYKRNNHDNFHVRGYKEQGNINTPLELAILNQVDRFDIAIDVIDRVPRLQATAAHTKEWLKDQIIDSINFAHENGIDREEIRDWKWPV